MDPLTSTIMLRPTLTQPSVSPLCMNTMMHGHTTIIAMRPPTSPTTVIGGFSLAIITSKTYHKAELVG